MSGSATGCGKLDKAEIAAALEMLRGGSGQREVAAIFGVTKNTIAGLWHRHGDPEAVREPSTVWTRCAALEARLMAVLSENDGVGRVPSEPRRR